MPDFRRMPLGQLILSCPPLLQIVSAKEHGAWRELQRRALVEQNPAAWDALMTRLWSSVLVWIYARAPEIAPATAELLAQRTIGEFKRRQMQMVHSSSDLPSYETFVNILKGLIAKLLTE